MSKSFFAQQRPVITKGELREQIMDILLEAVPGGPSGPKPSALHKSSETLEKIMQAIERYES